jgi:hypothetical protein
MPSRSQLEALRLPVALVLLVVTGFVLLPRFGAESAETVPTAPASPSIVVGDLSGAVVPDQTSTPTPIPTASPTRTASPTPTAAPTPTPRPATAAGVELLACRRISGARCDREIDDLDRNGRFTALVRFDDARAGDTVEVVLEGPSGSVTGGPYTLDGGGEGYYYATFSAGDLPSGAYTLVALWNGVEADTLNLER